MPPYEYLFLALLALVSLIAFCAYALDKFKAKRGMWRIPEAFLLGIGFCGGAIGALAGMQLLRHKTMHWYFWVVNVIGLVWQLAAAAYLFMM